MVDTHKQSLANSGSLYAILDVEKNASQHDIKKSYRKLALLYHPDKNPNDDKAADLFKDISKAYSVLSDETTRSMYDAYGPLGVEVCSRSKILKFLASRWCRAIFFFCGVVTCCCCCLCCNYCCGKCYPGKSKEFKSTPDEPVTSQPGSTMH